MIYLCELNTIFNVHYNDFYMIVFFSRVRPNRDDKRIKADNYMYVQL